MTGEAEHLGSWMRLGAPEPGLVFFQLPNLQRE